MDANIIIYSFKPEYSHLLRLLSLENEDIACSEMVRLEVLGFTGLLPAEKVQLLEFFANITVLPIDGDIIDQAIKLRQQKAIGSPDAIIAATALTAGQKLWTSNTKDFSWIDGLQWHNPITAHGKPGQLADNVG